MGKIEVYENKVLKISNALIREVPINEGSEETRVKYMMDAYVKSIGYMTKGPAFSYSTGLLNAENDCSMFRRFIILQLSEPHNQCDSPYIFTPVLRTGRCLFARFSGAARDIHHAYEKLGVYSYENGIELGGSCYSIITIKSQDEMSLDVFMPLRNEDDKNEALFTK